MPTLHAADAADGGAVLVDGRVITAVGSSADLAAAHPAARVRRWAGEPAPGRVADDARSVLEETYHPDPRDPGRARDRAESVRRGIHLLLARGVTAVPPDLLTDPAVRTALTRTGLLRSAPTPLLPGAPADFAVLGPDGTCLATVLGGRLVFRRT